MSERVDVEAEVLYDATRGWTRLGGVHETNRERLLALDIEKDQGARWLSVRTRDPKLLEDLGEDATRRHRMAIDDAQLLGCLQQVRQVWHTEVVDRKVCGRFPFQRSWDLSGVPGLREEVLRPLAQAGSQLFYAIFAPRPPDPRPTASLRRVARVLQERLHQTEPLWIKISSGELFAPWSLIYSRDPHREEIVPEGFWGYQHMVEHCPDRRGSIAFELDGSRPLRLGLWLDHRIDIQMARYGVECLKPVEDLLASYGPAHLDLVRSTSKAELERALIESLEDQVLYFCGHGQQVGDATNVRHDTGQLILGDGQPISPEDIRNWVGLGGLGHHPVVFLNACGGGQMSSYFYRSFGSVFLGLEASAVIGPQTAIPAVFAGQFARELLERFFAGKESLGEILFQLRRELLDQHHNPLGLAYSLYRGADIRMIPPLGS